LQYLLKHEFGLLKNAAGWYFWVLLLVLRHALRIAGCCKMQWVGMIVFAA